MTNLQLLKALAPVFSIRSFLRACPGPAKEASLNYFYQPSRFAGHSKWANIKHTKMAKDMEKSATITRFVNMVNIAVREGGGSADPKLNSKLAQVMAQIKDAKLPMAPFDRALAKESARKDQQRQTTVYKGPGGSIMIVELCSENVNRSKNEMNTILRKNKGAVAEAALLHQFEHKGILLSNEGNGKPAEEKNMDKVVEDAIEAGADDVTFYPDHPEFGNIYEFTTAPTAFFRVKHALEKLKYTIVSGDIEHIPKNPVELEGEISKDAWKLYEKLTEHPDVLKVCTNMQ